MALKVAVLCEPRRKEMAQLKGTRVELNMSLGAQRLVTGNAGGLRPVASNPPEYNCLLEMDHAVAHCIVLAARGECYHPLEPFRTGPAV